MTRILGIDYGLKFVGLAISDPSNQYSLPLEVISASVVFPHIRNLLSSEKISTIVIGLAQTPSGDETKVTRESRRLGARLTTLGVEVVFENEQLTTFAAKNLQLGATKTRFDDHLAASLILQQYLSRDV